MHQKCTVVTVQRGAATGREIGDQLHNLQAQAESLAPYLNWLPWAAGGVDGIATAHLFTASTTLFI